MLTGTMLQYFHWYTPQGGGLWKEIKEQASYLASIGVTAVWLPPAFKAASGGYSVGYDVYDLYDLGEFDQKGSVQTKYGTKEDYINAINACHENNIAVYADIVINHLAGADEKENITVIKVNPENRREFLSEPYPIEAFTKFTYAGRNKQYSSFEWNATCFTGIDYDASNNETGIFSILNEAGADWEEMIDDEKGNYDYLMYNDVEFRNPAVREELKGWGKWFVETTGVDGFRLDAVKHISPKFYKEWLDAMRANNGKEFFAVGEYWAPGNLPLLEKYITATDGRMSLFDASLHHNFHAASTSGNNYDLSTIFQNTLTATQPNLSVTVVDNHDTQPLQALEAPVEAWFKSLAYALILLRQEGYPCLFYPDLFGAEYTDKGRDGNDYTISLLKVDKLETLVALRKKYQFTIQEDYFDHANCIGWVRRNNEAENEDACIAVVLSNSDAGNKKMFVGNSFADKIFKDVLNNNPATITINQDGFGEFVCNAGSVSVWMCS
jgi:alpha-amylase